MSGGSFEYLCFKEPGQIAERIDLVEQMHAALVSFGGISKYVIEEGTIANAVQSAEPYLASSLAHQHDPPEPPVPDDTREPGWIRVLLITSDLVQQRIAGALPNPKPLPYYLAPEFVGIDGDLIEIVAKAILDCGADLRPLKKRCQINAAASRVFRVDGRPHDADFSFGEKARSDVELPEPLRNLLRSPRELCDSLDSLRHKRDLHSLLGLVPLDNSSRRSSSKNQSQAKQSLVDDGENKLLLKGQFHVCLQSSAPGECGLIQRFLIESATPGAS